VTIDQAIIRAAECAAEEHQTFYVHHAGPQYFVSPHSGLTETCWDLLVDPNGHVLVSPIIASEPEEICLCGAGLNTSGECEVDGCPVAPQNA